jgi:hypothetical protein
MKRFLVALTVLNLLTTAEAANDFSADSNCVALWRFENGALTTDSKGGNTLTASASAPTADTTNKKEGGASADCESSSTQYYYRTDANLDAGFPLRGADASPSLSFSLSFWINPESLVASATICSKDSGTGGLWVRTGADGKLEFYTFSGGWQLAEFGTAMTTGKWYHVGLTYNNSDKSYRIRIWDATAGALLGADVTGAYAGNVSKNAGSFRIAADGVNARTWDGLIDEFVVFKDVLTADEIDQIRGGTYGAAVATAIPPQIIIMD